MEEKKYIYVPQPSCSILEKKKKTKMCQLSVHRYVRKNKL